MKNTNLIFLVEEESMSYLLKGLMPRILDDNTKIEYKILHHDGKQDLKKRIPRVIQGGNKPGCNIFLILCDKDSNDCKSLKQNLIKLTNIEDKVISSKEKTNLDSIQKGVIVRIVCHELESWYLGDLEAVKSIFDTISKKSQNKKLYRNPDALGNPKEILQNLTNKQDKPIASAKEFGKKLSIDNNTSASFSIFIQTIEYILSNCN